jgi:hypothetical protein
MEPKMPRLVSKAALLVEGAREHEALVQLLSTLPPDAMDEAGIVGSWSVREVLAHLVEWQAMVLRWIAAGERGETPHVPAEGYTWRQLPALNEAIRLRYAGHALDDVLAMWRTSHAETMRAIEGVPEAALFEPGLYPWMNQNTLAAYFTSVTASHDRWARTEIRKGMRGR